MFSTWKKTLNFVLATLFFLSVISIVVSLFYRYEEEIRVDIILENKTPEVRPGQVVTIRLAENYEPRKCYVHVERWMIKMPFPSDPVMIEQFQTVTHDVRDEGPSTRNFRIPNDFAPGTYLYYISGNYHCTLIDYVLGGHDFKSSPVQIKVLPND